MSNNMLIYNYGAIDIPIEKLKEWIDSEINIGKKTIKLDIVYLFTYDFEAIDSLSLYAE